MKIENMTREQLIKKAYTDPKALQRLREAFYLDAQRVINLILKEHFNKTNKEQS